MYVWTFGDKARKLLDHIKKNTYENLDTKVNIFDSIKNSNYEEDHNSDIIVKIEKEKPMHNTNTIEYFKENLENILSAVTIGDIELTELLKKHELSDEELFTVKKRHLGQKQNLKDIIPCDILNECIKIYVNNIRTLDTIIEIHKKT